MTPVPAAVAPATLPPLPAARNGAPAGLASFGGFPELLDLLIDADADAAPASPLALALPVKTTGPRFQKAKAEEPKADDTPDQKDKQAPPVAVPAAELPCPVLPLVLNLQIPAPSAAGSPSGAKPPGEEAPVPAAVPTAPPALTAAGGSPWKQSAAPVLPDAELAFAARVTALAANHTDTAQTAPVTERETNPNQQRDGEGPGPRQQPEVTNSAPEPHKTAAALPVLPAESEPEPRAKTTVAAAEAPAIPFAAPAPPAHSDEPAKPAAKPEVPSKPAEIQTPAEPPSAGPVAPLRDISLHLSAADQDKVEVKVVQSAGEVRVAVRSADPELTVSLQQGLGDLVGRLESRGMHAETWKPANEGSGAAPAERAEGGQNGQPQSQGDGSPGRQWREQQQHQQHIVPTRRRNKPDWLKEIDGRLDTLPTDITRRTA